MRLPAEALLQYEELRAFIPDTTPRFELTGDELALLHVALSGDVVEFRSILRARGEFDETSASVLEEYVFARELALLFQRHKSVRIAKRTYGVVNGKFRALRPIAETDEQVVWLLKHSFGFCWDFQLAIASYIDGGKSTSNYFTAFCRSVCDLLEFARSCILSLGRSTFGHDPTVRDLDVDVFSSLSDPWVRWSKSKDTTETKRQSYEFKGPILDHALSSEHCFRCAY